MGVYMSDFLYLAKQPVCDKDDMATLVFLENYSTEQQQYQVLNSIIWVVRDGVARKIWWFNFPSSVGVFMLGRRFDYYQLFVGGRKYDWGTSSDIHVVGDNIEYYIDIEGAMYGNPLCSKYLDQRKKLLT